MCLNDVVIQEEKHGKYSKIFEVSYMKEHDGYRVKDSGDLKLFSKMMEPTVSNFKTLSN
jgi:ribulose 1,5-bisphosphate synthetase/thiazole synthase